MCVMYEVPSFVFVAPFFLIRIGFFFLSLFCGLRYISLSSFNLIMTKSLVFCCFFHFSKPRIVQVSRRKTITVTVRPRSDFDPIQRPTEPHPDFPAPCYRCGVILFSPSFCDFLPLLNSSIQSKTPHNKVVMPAMAGEQRDKGLVDQRGVFRMTVLQRNSRVRFDGATD